jgi:hypothetical protein
VIGMKLFGDTPTDMPYYNDQNNFKTFFSSLKLLFQLINGQDIKGMINDLGIGTELGWMPPFLYLASFFFLTGALPATNLQNSVFETEVLQIRPSPLSNLSFAPFLAIS